MGKMARPNKSLMEHAVVETELPDADTHIGLDILDILDAVPFYVMLIDAEHHILQVNKAVRTHLGVEPKDIIGKYCPKVIHQLDGPFDGCPLEEAVEKDQAVEREVPDHKSGRWLRSSIYPTRGLTPDGKRIYFHMVTDITDRKQAEEQLRISHERLRSVSAHLESAREEERKRIAHDLHDETSQILASLNAHLEAALGMLPASDSKTRAMLRKAQTLSIKILDQLHTLIYELRPFLLDDLGLVVAIGSMIDSHLKAAGVKVNFKTSGKVRRLPSQVETAIFRVIQEAFNNIARHAHAKNADIRVNFTRDAIRVHVADDGRGFDVEDAISTKRGLRGFGLLSMKERIELVNGTLTIQSSTGGSGTEINMEIPLNSLA